MKKGAHPADPRGLILEAYNIEDLSEKDCRTIFLDWRSVFRPNPTWPV